MKLLIAALPCFFIIQLPLGRALAQDATQYQLNASHDGSVTYATFGAPNRRWSVDLGQIVSYPVIANGEVYVTTGSFPASSSGSLYALNGQTGQVNWSVPIPGHDDTAAYGNGNLYVVIDNGFSSKLNAYNATNGTLLWSNPIGSDANYFFGTPPTVSNGNVYVIGGGGGGTLFAINGSTGSTLFKANTDGDGSSATVMGSSVFTSEGGPNSFSFNSTTGAINWQNLASSSGEDSLAPVYYNGTLYVTSGNTMYMMNPSTGALSQSVTFGTFDIPTEVAFNNGMLFADYFSTQGPTLLALNATTFATVWQYDLSGPYFSHPPIVINGIVFDATADGFVDEFNESTGVLIGSLSTGTSTSAAGGSPTSGMSSGDGLLAVPLGTTLTVYSVPEPSGIALATTGLLAFVLVIRQQQRIGRSARTRR